MLALDPPPAAAGWAIGAGGQTHRLAQSAVSGSGLAVQGEHITDPRSGRAANRPGRVWAFAATAAEADALSTAFFVMTDAEVAGFCLQHPAYGAVLTTADGGYVRHGALPPE